MKFFISLCIIICIATFSLNAQLSTNSTCYTIAHNNGTNNVLFKLYGQTNEWVEIGLTGADNIKSIATDKVNKIIYAVEGETFGKINPQTGLFSPIGAIGQAEGDFGTIVLNNIEGLSFDATNNIMYATHRIESGLFCNLIPSSNDLLFQIDVSTGQFINDIMLDSNGNLADYAVIEETIANNDYTCLAYDVNDIAYNAFTGELYTIQNNDYDCVITIIDKVDGTLEYQIQNLINEDFIGLSFNAMGNLFGTTGVNAPENKNSFSFIDLQYNGVDKLSHIDTTGNNISFESLDFIPAFNDLALKLSLSPTVSTPVKSGDEVVFIVTIINEGELDNTDIIISNYLTDGLTLNDTSWTLIPNTNIINYEYSGQLTPGNEISIPIHLTINNNFTGNEILNSAEITASYNDDIVDLNGDQLPLTDIDSDPGNFILNADEDDNDIATVTFNNSTTSNHFPCYTVSKNNGDRSNNLFEYSPSTQQWSIIGEIDPIGDLIEAIATDPIKNIIYAYDAGVDVLGIIDPNAANQTLFEPIDQANLGQGVGSANGDYGLVLLNDIKGLTFDPVNIVLYGSHRINSGELCNPISNTNDLLFQIDISTGKVIPNAMLDSNGNPADYAVIEESLSDDGYCNGTDPYIFYDVNDIAYNPYSNELYIVQNQNSAGKITVVDPVDGTVDLAVHDFYGTNFEGLGFGSFGKLYATEGVSENFTSWQSEFANIDLENQTIEHLAYPDSSGNNVDFDAFDCFTAFNDLALSQTLASNNSFTFSTDSVITFLINVYNQGDFANININITNYIPNGLVLNDANWANTESGKATYTITNVLEPGDVITVPIKFIIDDGFEGQTLTSATEISQSFSVNLIDSDGEIFVAPLPDVDSWPDSINDEVIENEPIVDNQITGTGPYFNKDQDDHDIASITIGQPVENLSLTTMVIPASCGGTGEAEIKILDDSIAPYTHKWSSSFGTTVHLETNTNLTHTVTELPADTYNVIVSDAFGKTSVFVVIIPVLATNNGNLNCHNSCPEYLSTSNELLYGIFQATDVVEIKGEVDGSQDAEFRICD